MSEKKCTKCKEVKIHNEFHKNKHTVTGLQSWCKLCNSKNKRDNYDPIKQAITRKNLQERKGSHIEKAGINGYQAWIGSKYLSTHKTRQACQQVIDKHRCRKVRRAIEKEKESIDNYWETL